ncbi:MAG: reverse transcriptase family protein [Desulfovibrio sp.]|uniref:reverse transcriptase family protein n=1 Tax=Desulfovibrio sp. TaxID=885 RepID=UPI002590B21D|nr:reverse transcriptase family protein [Desulfovibrio sp.]MCD7982712.1 reverse transcriptase family protein [Desulfovibrio sp.]
MQQLSPYTFLDLAEARGYSEAYKDAISNTADALSRSGCPIIFTLGHLAALADADYSYLHSIVSRTIDPYCHFSIPKRNGDRRAISAPHDKLKSIQKFILDTILNSSGVVAKISQFSFSYREKISIYSHAEKHVGAKWVVKIDIKDFFPSFTEIDVYRLMCSLGYAPLLSLEISRILTWPKNDLFLQDEEAETNHQKLLESKYKLYNGSVKKIGVLPQGAPTSPMLSNLLFKECDLLINEAAKEYGCLYTRYADDLIFSANRLSKQKAKELISYLRIILKCNKFEMNDSKTRVYFPGSKKIITGLYVNNNRPTLGKKYRDAIKKHIFFIEKFGIQKQADHAGSKDANTFLAHLIGKINFALHIEPNFALSQLQKLKNALKKANYINQKFYP